jgi:hypothetical protein
VETQSLLIEAFTESAEDSSMIEGLKTWLLKNKQTSSWKTTKATADACYALLIKSGSWLNDEPSVSFKLGGTDIKSSSTQKGTGYFKMSIPGEEVRSSMANVTVSVGNKQSASPSWGAIYWQYFEDVDKISSSHMGIRIVKKVMVQRNTAGGPVLDTLKADNTLNIGDKVKIRIEIRSDRDLEYVHLKDMRAAAFEPVATLSGYKWQGGLGYYESNKDASMNFYFNVLRKGTYVFEYEMFATQAGTFSNGITTMQCMYAPEFTTHSEGIKVNVKRP